MERLNKKAASLKTVSALALAAVLVLADQAAKRAAESALSGGRTIRLIPGVLELTLVHNEGAAFGLGQGMQRAFIVFAGVICVLLLYELIREGAALGGPLRMTSMALILAGAAGNAIDRIRFSSVIDFIYIRLIDFPVFNVADICVTAGCLLLALSIMGGDRSKAEKTGSGMPPEKPDGSRRGQQ